MLEPLARSDESGVAAQAEQLLELVERFRQYPAEKVQISGNMMFVSDTPQPPIPRSALETTGDEPIPEPPPPVESTPDGKKIAAIRWFKGTLVSADCSQPPSALLTIQSSNRTWRMLVRDTKKLVLIADEQFSCSWKNRKVLVNYREGGAADADVVSLELQ